MGGKGSGGARVGAGAKRKSHVDGALTGSRRTRARSKRRNQISAPNQNKGEPVSGQTTPAGPVQIPEPPGNLTLDELVEWNELAPLAAKAGTLVDDTRMALRDLCQARVLKDKLLRTLGDHGNVVATANGTLAAHPLLSRFTTLLQRVDAGMMRFKLAPMGKEIESAGEKPDDPFAEFSDPVARTNADGDPVH